MQPAELTRNPEVMAVTSEVAQIETKSIALVIHNPAGYQASAEELMRIKAAQKKIEAVRVSITAPLNASLKAINDFFRGPADRLLTAERNIKRAIGVYDQEQERIRREEQRKADERAAEARRKAEADARELERVANEKAAAERAEADRQREAAQRAQREAAEARERGDAEAARIAQEQQQEAARLAAKAAAAAVRTEEKGAVRASEALDKAASVVAPQIVREAPKVSGVSKSTIWKFTIEDQNLVPREYMTIDLSRIRKVVGALKGEVHIPGVRVYSEQQISAGSK